MFFPWNYQVLFLLHDPLYDPGSTVISLTGYAAMMKNHSHVTDGTLPGGTSNKEDIPKKTITESTESLSPFTKQVFST